MFNITDSTRFKFPSLVFTCVTGIIITEKTAFICCHFQIFLDKSVINSKGISCVSWFLENIWHSPKIYLIQLTSIQSFVLWLFLLSPQSTTSGSGLFAPLTHPLENLLKFYVTKIFKTKSKAMDLMNSWHLFSFLETFTYNIPVRKT